MNPEEAASNLTLAVRGHHLRLGSDPLPGGESTASNPLIEIRGTVDVTEITGSESYIHVDVAGLRWVVLAQGIHNIDIDTTIEIFLDPSRFYVFDKDQNLVVTPESVS